MGLACEKVHIRAITRAKENKKLKLAPLCRAYGITPQGYYQAMGRMAAHIEQLKPVKDLVMYWRQFMPRVGGKKLYKPIKPKLEECKFMPFQFIMLARQNNIENWPSAL